MKYITDRQKQALKTCYNNIIEVSEMKNGRFSDVVCGLYASFSNSYANMIIYGASKSDLEMLISVCNSYRYVGKYGLLYQIETPELMRYVTITDGCSCDLNTHLVF